MVQYTVHKKNLKRFHVKRCIVIVLIVLFLPSLIFAQNTLIGVKGGVNGSWYSGSNWDYLVDTTETDNTTTVDEIPAANILIGLYLETMLSRHIGIIAEVNYTRYGQDIEYPYMGYTVNSEFRQEVVEIPLMLKIAYSPFNGAYALIGASLQLPQSDLEIKHSVGGTSSEESIVTDNTMVYNVLGGLGYDLPFAKGGVLKLEGRYCRNLTYASDSKLYQFDVNALQLLIGYGFNI